MLNGALFYIDWRNIQQAVSLPTCGFAFFANVGAAAIKGGEIELRASPVHGLTLGISATYADAYLTKVVPGTQGQAGDPIEDSPEVRHGNNENIEYTFPLTPQTSGFARADYQWHGSQTNSFNRTVTSDVDPYSGVPYGSTRTIPDPSYLQASYDLLNTSVGIVYRRWTTRLYIDNVADKHPLLSIGADGSLQTTASYPAAFRTIGVAVSGGF